MQHRKEWPIAIMCDALEVNRSYYYEYAKQGSNESEKTFTDIERMLIDLFSRQIIGWSIQDHMRTSLCLDALKMAWFRRKRPIGVMHHSDRGSQYASYDYRNQLKHYGMIQSMSRKGNCWESLPHEVLWVQLADRTRIQNTEIRMAKPFRLSNKNRSNERGMELHQLLQ